MFTETKFPTRRPPEPDIMLGEVPKKTMTPAGVLAGLISLGILFSLAFVTRMSASHRDEYLFCGGIFTLCYALWSLKSGTTLLFHRDVKLSDDALQYWIGEVVNFTVGIALMIAVLIDWHQRTAGR
jgi:hypothetical protein